MSKTIAKFTGFIDGERMGQEPWIGVDLDGTLAHYDAWTGVDHIGDPIPAMVERVQRWVAAGRKVRIVTARVSRRGEEGARARTAIAAWCRLHLGFILPVTDRKDYSMIELWDDRCVQVIPNTGKRADGKE